MVTILPFAPSSYWYSEWLTSLCGGDDESEAILKANKKTGEIRNAARCNIISNSSESMYLSIPVVGGGRRLKNPALFNEVILSDHGDWKRVHVKALEAAYGKMPFYEFLSDELKRTYLLEITYLSEFNHRVHSMIKEWLFKNMKDIKEILCPFPLPAVERGKEILEGINPSLSIIDLVMRHGTESILAIKAMNSFLYNKEAQ